MLALLPLLLPCQEPPASVFEVGLAAVAERVDDEAWEEARDGLRGLLDLHAGEEQEVLPLLPVVEHLLVRIELADRLTLPAPDEVVRGQIVSWRPSTGAIELRYVSETLADFEAFEELSLHPAVFAGSYGVVVRGSRFPKVRTGRERPRFYLDVREDQHVRLDVGVGGDVLTRASAAGLERLDSNPSSAFVRDEPYELRIKVGDSSIVVHSGKKKLLSARRGPSEGGRFGYERLPRDAELVLKGQIDPGWIRARQNAGLEERRARLLEGHDPARALEGWLPLPEAGSYEDLPTTLAESGPSLERELELRERIVGHLQDGKEEKARRHLEEVERETVDSALYHGLMAVVLESLGDWEGAVAAWVLARGHDPDWLQARARLARALDASGRRAEAVRELHELVEVDPRGRAGWPDLVRLQLERGRRDAARAALRDAAAVGAYSDELHELNRLMTLAGRGPDWPESFEVRSAHYVVRSDIDKRVCRVAADVLESSLERFTRRLGEVEDFRDEPFEVFLFSGEAGYRRYAQGALGADVENTAGIYSPVLRQLLIWNVPDRDQMLQTIRHEGFHQFLDRLVEDAPIWLNEGLAEYYESADFTKGASRQIPVNLQHLLTVRRTRTYPLRVFVNLGRGGFYASRALNYGHAWALVHFLQNGGPAERRLFDRLLKELRSGASASAAVERAFAEVDFQELDQRFAEYVRELEP